jgi:hypothetical protein
VGGMTSNVVHFDDISLSSDGSLSLSYVLYKNIFYLIQINGLFFIFHIATINFPYWEILLHCITAFYRHMKSYFMHHFVFKGHFHAVSSARVPRTQEKKQHSPLKKSFFPLENAVFPFSIRGAVSVHAHRISINF